MLRNIMKKTAMAAAITASLAAVPAFAAITNVGGDTDATVSLGQQTPAVLNTLTVTGSANNELAVAGNLTSIFAGKGDFAIANNSANPITVSVTNGATNKTATAVASVAYAANEITVTWAAASVAGDVLTIGGLDVVNNDADGLGATTTATVALTADLANAGAGDVATATVATVSQAQAATVALARANAKVVQAGTNVQVDLTATATGSAALPQSLRFALKNGSDPAQAGESTTVAALAAADVALSSFATQALANDAAGEAEVVAVSWTQTGAATVAVTALDSDDGANTLINGTTATAQYDGIHSLQVTADAATVVTLTAVLDNGQTATHDITFEPVGVAAAIVASTGFITAGVAGHVTLVDANGLTVAFANSEVVLSSVDTANTSFTAATAQPNVTATATGSAVEVVPSTLTYTKGGVTISSSVDVVIGTAANAKTVVHSVGAGSGYWTGVGVSNDNVSSASDYQMIGRSATGAYVGAKVGTIAKGGKVSTTADAAFGADAAAVAYIDLTTSQSGEAFQLFGQAADVDGAAFTNMGGVNVAADLTAGTYELPHFDSSADFWTGIAIVNGATAQSATLTLTGADGVVIGTQAIALAAGAKVVNTLAGLFGSAQGTGTLSFTITQDAAVLGLIGNAEGSSLTGLNLQ